MCLILEFCLINTSKLSSNKKNICAISNRILAYLIIVLLSGFKRDEGKVSIQWGIEGQQIITHSPFLYIIKAGVSFPYPGDSIYLVTGQKSDAPFWQ